MGASAMAADPTGSGVSDRLVPEEPMSIILNLGISCRYFSRVVTLLFTYLTSPNS